MHGSLKQSTNRLLTVVWAAGAATLLVMYREEAMPPMVVGAVAGVIAGFAQARALWVAPATFARATSLADVRRQLTDSFAGKLSIAVVWIGAGAIAWVVWNLSRGYLVGTFAAGYVTLMFFRESITLFVVGRVERARERAG